MKGWTLAAALVPALLLLALSLLALSLPGCGDGAQVDPLSARIQAAEAARAEGYDLLQAERVQAARETFRRAYEEARNALKLEAEGNSAPPPVEGEPAARRPERPDILNLLSLLSWELARWEPAAMGKAIRYARQANELAPGWGVPHLSAALAYQHAGILREALGAFREYFASVPEEHWETIAFPLYLKSHFLLALDVLRADHLGAEAEARRILERGFELEPSPAANPDVHGLLSEINARYQSEYRAAAEAEDGLEIVRIHARFGFPGPASDALTIVRNQLGRTLDVRWVEVRYVEELDSANPEALESARKHYLEFLESGERVLYAAAGYGRVMLALNRGEEALKRIGGYDDPSVELRRVLMLLHLERLGRIAPENEAAIAEEYDRIQEYLEGSLLDWDRANGYWQLGLVTLARKDQDRLVKLLNRFRKRYPGDMRTVILEAELLELRGVPIEEGVPDGK